MRSTLRRAPAMTLVLMLSFVTPAVAQWQLASVATRAEFRGLSLVSNTVAWASGAHGTVARTTDGGATWTLYTVSGADSLDLRSIVGLSSDVAVTASAGAAEEGQARIFRTADGGATWSVVFATNQAGVFFDAMAFWDSRHGIAQSDPVDGTFFLLTTDDGGATWTRVPSAALPPTLSGEAAFAASGTCMVVWGSADVWIGTGGGARARVFHSGDGGRTWTASDTPVHAGSSASGIFALAFRDAMHGVAVGGDYTAPHGHTMNAAITDDGGLTWRAAHGPLVPAYLSGLSFAGTANDLIAVGLAGTALSSDGGDSWIAVDSLAFDAVRVKGAFWAAAGPHGRLGRWIGALRHALGRSGASR